jgi:dipeptidyl aminopeptidase/acylaminoacyl peptidase
MPAHEFAAWSPTLRSAATLSYKGWSSGLHVTGAHARVVATLNANWRDRPLGAVRPISYVAGGRPLRGWVVTPPGRRDTPAPAIVWIYGGQLLPDDPPFEATPGLGPTPVFDGQLWAAQGYAVIYPSAPIGRGANTDVPGALAEAAVAAVDAAAKAGWVDPDRVAIAGHSFGGFATAAVLARRSDRFRAGVALSGIYDFATGWGSRSPSDVLVDAKDGGFTFEMLNFVEQGQIGLEAPPWRAVDAYVRSSPLYNVEQIRTPLLLTVGDLDVSVSDLLQSERFYAALRRTGNPAVLVRYWGEGHVRSDPGGARDEWRRLAAWFAHYLKAAGAAPTPSRADGSANAGPTTPPTPPKAPRSAAPPG